VRLLDEILISWKAPPEMRFDNVDCWKVAMKFSPLMDEKSTIDEVPVVVRPLPVKLSINQFASFVLAVSNSSNGTDDVDAVMVMLCTVMLSAVRRKC
jgi:hypothetical protein